MYTKYHMFKNIGLKNFISSCHTIESDPNYQPDINNKQLFALVVDEKGNARHTPRQSALAIQPINEFIPISSDGSSMGALYQIKIARKSCIDGDDYPVWNIDTSVVIFVNKKGEITIHNSKEAKIGNLTAPLSHLSIDMFLNSKCLHYPETNNNKISNF